MYVTITGTLNYTKPPDLLTDFATCWWMQQKLDIYMTERDTYWLCFGRLMALFGMVCG